MSEKPLWDKQTFEDVNPQYGHQDITFVARIMSDEAGGGRYEALVALDYKGNIIRELVRSAKNEQLSTFDVSFDQNWVAYTCYIRDEGAHETYSQVRVVSLVSNQQTVLLPRHSTDTFQYQNPVFAPDKLQLVCQYSLNIYNNPDLYVMGLEEVNGKLYGIRNYWIQNPMRIGLHSPFLMHGGQRIAYYSNQAYEDALEVCVADLPDASSSEIEGRIVTSGADGIWRNPHAVVIQPQWEQIFFIRGHMADHQTVSVVRPADMPEPIYLQQFVTLGGEFNEIGKLQMSSDGMWLIFDADGAVYAMGTDGGSKRRISQDGLRCKQPTLSRTNNQLAFLSDGALHTCDITGNNYKTYKITSFSISNILWV